MQQVRNRVAHTVVFTDNRRVFPVRLRVVSVENVPAQLPRAPDQPVVKAREVLRCLGEVESHVRFDSQFNAVGAGLEVREAQPGVVHFRHSILQICRHAFDLSSVPMVSL